VAASRKIIEALLDDLAVAVNDTTVIYERYRVNPVEMESRNDIPEAGSLYMSRANSLRQR